MTSTTEQPTTAYAKPDDRFVTIVYRSDYSGQYRTCLKVDGLYIHSTDSGHGSERRARETASTHTYFDNGRRDQVYTPTTAEWVSEGEA